MSEEIKRLIIRNDTHENWEIYKTKILLKGEVGFELDTGKYKIGDGLSTWENLPYYTHLTSEKATSLDTLISMLNNDEFGKVDDVKVNGSSVLNASTKIASIVIGTLTTSTSAQTVPQSAESFTGSITLHKVAKTGNYADLIDKLVAVDNLNSTSTTQPLSANQGKVLNSIIQALPTAVSYSNISAMITALNAADDDDFNVGNDLYIVATGVPDFWISAKETTSSTYTYTTDNAFINAVSTNGYVQVGYYKVSMLETEKVDLTSYVQKTTTIAGVDLADDITKSELLTALNVEDGAEVNDVTDIQINGTSILSNKVANIVTNTAYDASTNKIATESDVSSVAGRVTTLEGQMSTVQTSTFQNGSSIYILTSRVDGLDTRVTTLENGGGSGGGGSESINLIYDMRSNDSNINMGLTSGATCGTLFRLDYSVYKSIRLYCSINGCEVQKVIKVAERKKSDITVWAINSTFNQISYLRFVFPVNNTVLQVGQYALYSYDFNNSNQLSVSKGTVNTNFYVYRLEGIY